MFAKHIHLLTTEQKHALHAAGISRFLLSDWRAGRRLPTEPQAIIYAEIAGLDRHQLQDEIALLRATPEQRSVLQRVMGKIKGGAAASFGLAVLAVAALAGTCTPSQARELAGDNV